MLIATLSAMCVAGCGDAGRPMAGASKHAVSGTVKSVDATTLVITRAGNRSEMSFVLNPSTRREGEVGVGATVQVRFDTEGPSSVVRAILVTAPARREPGQPAER